MAEQVVLVCDVCGEVARSSVAIRVDGRALTKDLCERHLQELVAGARRPRPGRRRKTVSTPSAANKGSQKKASNKRSSRKKTTRRRQATGSKSDSA